MENERQQLGEADRALLGMKCTELTLGQRFDGCWAVPTLVVTSQKTQVPLLRFMGGWWNVSRRGVTTVGEPTAYHVLREAPPMSMSDVTTKDEGWSTAPLGSELRLGTTIVARRVMLKDGPVWSGEIDWSDGKEYAVWTPTFLGEWAPEGKKSMSDVFALPERAKAPNGILPPLDRSPESPVESPLCNSGYAAGLGSTLTDGAPVGSELREEDGIVVARKREDGGWSASIGYAVGTAYRLWTPGPWSPATATRRAKETGLPPTAWEIDRERYRARDEYVAEVVLALRGGGVVVPAGLDAGAVLDIVGKTARERADEIAARNATLKVLSRWMAPDRSLVDVAEAFVRYVGSLEKEGARYGDLCSEAHQELNNLGVAYDGTPAERVKWLGEKLRTAEENLAKVVHEANDAHTAINKLIGIGVDHTLSARIDRLWKYAMSANNERLERQERAQDEVARVGAKLRDALREIGGMDENDLPSDDEIVNRAQGAMLAIREELDLLRSRVDPPDDGVLRRQLMRCLHYVENQPLKGWDELFAEVDRSVDATGKWRRAFDAVDDIRCDILGSGFVLLDEAGTDDEELIPRALVRKLVEQHRSVCSEFARWRQHIRPEVAAFAKAMEDKLRLHDGERGRKGWDDAGVNYLIGRLRDEVNELDLATGSLDTTVEQMVAEAADVGNFAMMIADVVGGLRTNPTIVGPVKVHDLRCTLHGGADCPKCGETPKPGARCTCGWSQTYAPLPALMSERNAQRFYDLGYREGMGVPFLWMLDRCEELVAQREAALVELNSAPTTAGGESIPAAARDRAVDTLEWSRFIPEVERAPLDSPERREVLGVDLPAERTHHVPGLDPSLPLDLQAEYVAGLVTGLEAGPMSTESSPTFQRGVEWGLQVREKALAEREQYAHDKALAWAATKAGDYDPFTRDWLPSEQVGGERALSLFANRLLLEVKGGAHKRDPYPEQHPLRLGRRERVARLWRLLRAAAQGNETLTDLVALLAEEVENG